jgi:hypothetical protein
MVEQLIEQQTTQYQEYLDSGGLFKQEDYDFITGELNIDDLPPLKSCNIGQIEHISYDSGVVPTFKEILLYNTLRIKMYPQCKNSSCPAMSDHKLIREIFFLTDPDGDKYRAITERYPHMYD